MSWTHEDYYDFYGFKFAKRKVTRLRSLFHENHKYVIGMIGSAVFFVMNKNCKKMIMKKLKKKSLSKLMW